MNYATYVSAKKTPQTEPIFGRTDQVQNSAGGFVFAIDDWQRLDRFLIIGAEGGTYYVDEKKLTKDNASAVVRCINADGERTVKRIVEISEAGRAPKNDPAIFAMALCASLGDVKTKAFALGEMHKVCRIGTHLFQFVEALKALRGRGRAVRRAINEWYTSKAPNAVAYQMVKYQQRNGWSHRDLLRLCKPANANEPLNSIFKWAVGKGEGWAEMDVGPDDPLAKIVAFEQAKKETDNKKIAALIRKYDLPRECVPTEALNDVGVWEALLERMPMTAMVRNLAKMTSIGLLAPMSDAAGKVLTELGNVERIRKSRLHPIAILMALRTYAKGHGDKGSLRWTPVPQVLDALNEAFYLSFDNVEPTGKRWLLGIDVSGSMGACINNTSLSCCEGATAMAMVTAHTEKNYHINAFDCGLKNLPISKGTRLDDALRHTRNINGGGTDCAMPMTYALANKIPVDVFVVLTDSETWAGNIQPCQALNAYRQKMGIPAKQIVIGMISSGFTIADPNDAGCLDVVGFDAGVPSVMADFVRS